MLLLNCRNADAVHNLDVENDLELPRLTTTLQSTAS